MDKYIVISGQPVCGFKRWGLLATFITPQSFYIYAHSRDGREIINQERSCEDPWCKPPYFGWCKGKRSYLVCSIYREYGCAGFDTFGPFKLVGGLQKGHPDADEIAGAVKLFEGLK